MDENVTLLHFHHFCRYNLNSQIFTFPEIVVLTYQTSMATKKSEKLIPFHEFCMLLPSSLCFLLVSYFCFNFIWFLQ